MAVDKLSQDSRPVHVVCRMASIEPFGLMADVEDMETDWPLTPSEGAKPSREAMASILHQEGLGRSDSAYDAFLSQHGHSPGSLKVCQPLTVTRVLPFPSSTSLVLYNLAPAPP